MLLRSESEYVRRMIRLYPSGVVSIVADTYDFWNVVTNVVTELKDEILARRPDALGLAKVVFRPDSGDPVDIICGSANVQVLKPEGTFAEAQEWAKDILRAKVAHETAHGTCGPSSVSGFFEYQGQIYKAVVDIEWNRHDKRFYYIDDASLKSFEPAVLSPAEKGAIGCLWDAFGGTLTSTGHRMLNPRVGLIYGDSITLDRASRILQRLEAMGYASGNVVFGIGSFTYNFLTRDTFGHAYKATWAVVNGERRELFKDPVTDSGAKKSAKGLLRVEREGDDFVLYDQQTPEQEKAGELQTVFLNGGLRHFQPLSEIRERLLNTK